MFARALLLLLVMLNLGVALWWAMRAESSTRDAPVDAPVGVARLQLASETTVRPSPPRSPQPVTPDEASVAAAPQQVVARCVALGPFADAAAAGRARTALAGAVSKTRAREVPSSARGWRVVLPAQSDRAAATAMADRLRQAGFSDLYVVGDGAEANSIALGRFGGEEAANSHVAKLRDAGFEARAEAVGGGVQHWLDVALTEASSPEAARRSSNAPRADGIDCARLGIAATGGPQAPAG